MPSFVSVWPPKATNTSAAPIAIRIVTTCFLGSNILIRWLHRLDFWFDCIRLTCVIITKIVHHCLVSVCLSTVPTIVLQSKKLSFRPVSSMIACGSPLMCSAFSVCSERFSVIMMSMISCNLLLASVGASSSTVRFHPLGVLSNCMTLPVSMLYANARSGPKPSHLCLSRFSGRWFAFCIFGHKQTLTLISHNRLASYRVRYSSFSIPVTSVPSCCWMPWRHQMFCSLPCRLQTWFVCTFFCLIWLQHLLPQCCEPSTCYTHNCFANFCSQCCDLPSVCSESNFCINLCPNFCSNICDHPSSCSEPNSQFCDHAPFRSETNFLMCDQAI